MYFNNDFPLYSILFICVIPKIILKQKVIKFLASFINYIRYRNTVNNKMFIFMTSFIYVQHDLACYF